MEYEEAVFNEDKEFEKAIVKAPAIFKQSSYIKEPMDIIRNVEYQKWRGTPKASTAWMLLGYVIRARCGNGIADKIYEEYYKKRHLLAARYTHQGLADMFGYKGRQGVTNHIKACKDEGIFTIEEMPWFSRGRTRNIKIYVFGSWQNIDDNYIETIDMFTKFRKESAEKKLSEIFK